MWHIVFYILKISKKNFLSHCPTDVGIILYLLLLINLQSYLSSFQLWSFFVVFSSIYHEISLRFTNNFYSCFVILWCINRWLALSSFSPRKQYLGHKDILILIRMSCIRIVLRSHTKHAILWGILVFQMCFQGQLICCWLKWFISL